MTSIVKTELELREKIRLQRESFIETKDKLIETKDKFKEKVANKIALAMDSKSTTSATNKKSE